jgi:hypothetical protein
MKNEFDAALVTKYPKIFVNRHGDMKETLMCWGFECGDGWYNILDVLCSNIQSHINYSRKQRANAFRKNRALKRALLGDSSWLIRYYKPRHKKDDPPSDWVLEHVKEDIKKLNFAEHKESIPQVVAMQVKEKFGTLRFYYSGGDDVIDGMVSIAESLSAVTCEECGSPGSTRDGGWIRTLCDKHEAEYQARKKIKE